MACERSPLVGGLRAEAGTLERHAQPGACDEREVLDLLAHRIEQGLRRALMARGLERERQPQERRVAVLAADPGSVLGKAYDVVEPAIQERL